MIIVTVGTQLPFDRLITMIDEIAPDLPHKVFAQTGPGTYLPKNIEWKASIPAREFEPMLREAAVIVAHAGIGTVLKAYKYEKPIILVPRRASFGEHRNDHQLATVSQLERRPGIYIAELKEELASLLSEDLLPAVAAETMSVARGRLQSFVRQKIQASIVKKARG